MKINLLVPVFFVLLITLADELEADGVPAEKSFLAPHGMKISVKMAAPYAQATDLQIICVFKHKVFGDPYIAAMQVLDDKLGGLLSSLRNGSYFSGELGETIAFIPLVGSVPARQFLVIGLGNEPELSLQSMRLIGSVGLREAIRLKASHVSFAPVLRDQGSSRLDVGAVARSVEEGVILAYDTEKRLQANGLASNFNVADWTIEAGPQYFAKVATQLPVGIEMAEKQISERRNDGF